MTEPSRHKHTILVVDDEPDVVKSVQDLLRLDYRVLEANSASMAMRILGEQNVEVIMTDQRMPDMNGVQFLHQLREQHPEVVRLLFTGYTDLSAVIDAINEGSVYRYITKPWDPDELQSVIRQAVERYELRAERKRLVGQLQEKNKQLAEANELKTAFIRVVSHELRTPLTILLGATRLAIATSGNCGETKELLGRIEQAEERLGYLVDQIVTMLALGQFDSRPQRSACDLAELLEQSIDDVRPFVEVRCQQLVTQVPGDLGTFELDEHKIRDIFNHLLLNAVKFTPDGGTITVAAQRQGESVQITVHDTGAGIDPAALPRVFQPFFTGLDVSHHSSGTFEYGKQGLGLGLSVVKAFVEMHGGSIDVQSQPGIGTKFTVLLPARQPQEQVAGVAGR